MSENPSNGVVIGKVLGYSRGWNLKSHESSVVVAVDKKKVLVSIDFRQQKFIQKEYPAGSLIPIGFYDGHWHIGSKLSEESLFTPEAGTAFMDVLNGIPAKATH